VSAVISVRVPKWLKEKLERYGVDIAGIIRRRLLEEIERIEEKELEEILDFLKVRLKSRINPYELARFIDEERKRR